MPYTSLARRRLLPVLASAVAITASLVAPTSASAATHGFVGGPVPIGTFADVGEVAVDAVTGRLWFQADGALTVVDGTDLRPVARVATGWALLAIDPLSRVAVAKDGDDLVAVHLDRLTETARTTVPLSEVDVDPIHHRLVGVQHDTTDDCIVVLDEYSLAITARQCFPRVDQVEFDVHADAVLATVLIGGVPLLASFDSATVLHREVLVSPPTDLAYGNVIAAWHVDRASRSMVLEITDTTAASSTYALYDLARREAVTAFPVEGGTSARFVIGADSTILQLTTSSVTVIDARTGSARQVVTLPRSPYQASVDAATGDLYLFQSLYAPTVIRLAWV